VYQSLDAETGCSITGCDHPGLSCDMQKTMLDLLAEYPAAERAEVFARLLDAARSRHHDQ
jgi:hypothetical protein